MTVSRELTTSVLSIGHVHGSTDVVMQHLSRLDHAAPLLLVHGVAMTRAGGPPRWWLTGDTWHAEILIQQGRCARHEALFTRLPAVDVLAVLHSQAGQTEDPVTASVLDLLRRALAPFTAPEIHLIKRLNPAVRSVEVPPGGSAALLLVREHPLLEKLNVIDSLTAASFIAPADVFFAAKPDRTGYRNRVLAEIARRGCTVAGDDWRGELRDFLMRRSSASGAVVIDDGGELILAVEHLRRTEAAATMVRYIETNASGVQRLRAAGLLGLAENLSDSREKQDANTAIALSGVHALKCALQHHPQMGHLLHVVGYGRIGEQVAHALRANFFDVTVSDVLQERRSLAEAAGFDVYPSSTDALRARRHRYLIGCSGGDAVGLAEIKLLEPHAVVAALSSKDVSRALAEATIDPAWLVAADSRSTILTGPDREVVEVLAHGHAVNLHGFEGVPEPDFDAFMALITRAAVSAAHHLASRSTPDNHSCCSATPEPARRTRSSR